MDITKTVTLSRREMEVLNTCLSAEIMKQHLRYGEGASNERLNTLYSLRDKLVASKGGKDIEQVIDIHDEMLRDAPEGSNWYADFPKGSSQLGTITICDKVYTAYIGNVSGHVLLKDIKHKFTIIEV